MAKFVVCIDGTWDSAGNKTTDPVSHHEVAAPTNVVLTWESLTGKSLASLPAKACGVDCMMTVAELATGDGEAAYFTGVATSGPRFEQFLEGTMGAGTAHRVRVGYEFLARRVKSGDHIYLFGFSRGAFTVRSLAGFLHFAGLPPAPFAAGADVAPAIEQVYAHYRRRDAGGRPASYRPAVVEFLGVWDTVGALAFGMGDPGGLLATFDYHDINPGNVLDVAHAVALDERRKLFAIQHWTAPARTCRTVWFCGAHANVGGGYANAGLSNITLHWMHQRAALSGLQLNKEFDDAFVSSERATLRDSYDDANKSLGFLGRFLEELGFGMSDRSVREGDFVHESVLARLDEDAVYVPAAVVEPAWRPTLPLTSWAEPWIRSGSKRQPGA